MGKQQHSCLAVGQDPDRLPLTPDVLTVSSGKASSSSHQPVRVVTSVLLGINFSFDKP